MFSFACSSGWLCLLVVCFCFDLGYGGLLLAVLGFPALLVVFTLVVVGGFWVCYL